MTRELPPTAGLPLCFGDLFSFGSHEEFTAQVATWLGARELQLECSGTASLVLLLHAMKRLKSERNEVVVPAWTCPLVALAVQRAGLVTRVCDLARDGIDMDENALRAVAGERTLAIVPTHLAGRVADVKTSISIANKIGAFVIEDAAQALGARVSRRSVGIDGDAGFFSLAVGKGLTLYEGGLLHIRDATLRDAFATVRPHIVAPSAAWEWRRSLELMGYAALYRPSLLSIAYGRPLRRALAHGDPVAAVGDDFGTEIPLHDVGNWRRGVGARAFARLPDFLAAAQRRALPRAEHLRGIAGVDVLGDPHGAQGVWPFLLVAMPNRAARDRALQVLWTSGLGVSRLFIHALPDYDYLKSVVQSADVPNARDLAARTLTITNSPWLDDNTFERICDELRRAVS